MEAQVVIKKKQYSVTITMNHKEMLAVKAFVQNKQHDGIEPTEVAAFRKHMFEALTPEKEAR